MRLNLTLTRDEHPALFAELEKVGKGIKRTQRLKTLASERLLLDVRLLSAAAIAMEATAFSTPPAAASETEIGAAHELFSPPIK